MGIFDGLRRNRKTEPINEEMITKLTGYDETRVDNEVSNELNVAPIAELIDFIKEAKDYSKDRRELLVQFEEMSKDSLIASALELLVDDSTQEDDKTKKIFWIKTLDTENSSDDEERRLELEQALEDMKVNEKAWSYAYKILKDGGVMLKTYFTEFTSLKKALEDDSESGLKSMSNSDRKYNEILVDKLGYMFEIVDDYSQVSDLQQYGDTVGYGVQKKDEEDKYIEAYDIFSRKDFIHILDDRGVHRDKLNLQWDLTDEDIDKKKKEFKVRYGTSYLESVIEAYKIVDLLETILVYLRFGKSSIYRLFEIEVGGAGRAETAKLLREFKQKISSVASIDTDKGQFYSSKKPLPYAQNVYTTTRNGKGTVNQQLVGGDVNIKDIVDIDYFKNKLFAALRIPKAFLGNEESVAGGIGNQSLTRIDIRYARTVNRIKSILKSGIKDMLDFWCSVTGHSNWIDLYEVQTSKIATADEGDKREELLADIEVVNTLADLFGENKDNRKILEIIIRDVLGMDKVWDTVEEFLKEQEEEQDGEAGESNNTEEKGEGMYSDFEEMEEY